MNKLILCEGETDAILLSYFLKKVANWEFCRKGPKNLDIQKYNDNESINWYRKGEDYLLICAVGGKDNFGNFFNTRIKTPLVTVNAFGKIAIITDHDDREVDEISQLLLVAMGKFFTDIQNRVWSNNSYQDAFGMEKTIKLLLLVIPSDARI